LWNIFGLKKVNVPAKTWTGVAERAQTDEIAERQQWLLRRTGRPAARSLPDWR
jgi:hypothetical protein